MTSSLTYVYCLVRSARPLVLRPTASPMPGSGPLRALRVEEGLWLVVSSVPARDYGEEAVARGLQDLDWVGARAVAHETVVERFLSAAALLPMQLFTLFTSDERAIEHVSGDRLRINRILTRVERQLEFGLRLTWNEERSNRAASAKSSLRRPPASGASYLARKRDLRDSSRVAVRSAQVEANRLYRAVAKEASEAHRRTSLERAAPGSRLLLDAAFLVPWPRAKAFRSAVRGHARDLETPGIDVSLTGPWPPYNFVTPARPAAGRGRGRR